MHSETQDPIFLIEPLGGGDGEEQVGDLALVVALDGNVGHVFHILVAKHLVGLSVRPFGLRQLLGLLLEVMIAPAYSRDPGRTGADINHAHGSLGLAIGSLD